MPVFRTIKYLGIMLGSKLTFTCHFRAVLLSACTSVKAMGHPMPNVGSNRPPRDGSWPVLSYLGCCMRHFCGSLGLLSIASIATLLIEPRSHDDHYVLLLDGLHHGGPLFN